MKILVTGAAGFIGFHVTRALIARGDTVVGLDNINDYYDPALKHARLDILNELDGFSFHKIELADKDAVARVFENEQPDKVTHLAAQAGVRYSIENPYAYIESNILGHLNILEGCRHSDCVQNLVYASSSSVYGMNENKPFKTNDFVDNPISLYAATKKSDELMSYCYSHLYKTPMSGLRFFTVYGPYGRPDMAYFSFTKDILEGRAIKVFNHGQMRRDFTYIDDIVAGVLGALDNPPAPDAKGVAHKVYNLGNNQSEALMDFITTIEGALGVEADKEMLPMQAGDVVETYADITDSQNDLGYNPQTPISKGILDFVAWYRGFYKI
jgi:UDP-glucuronate 4-epimerase